MVQNTRTHLHLRQDARAAAPTAYAAHIPGDAAPLRRFDIRVPVRLDQETRTALPTSEAAYHLNRAEQTLRIWACRENGPLRPVRIHGRLAWPVADIRKLVGVGK